MTEQQNNTIYFVLHRLDDASASATIICIAEALIAKGIEVHLIVLDGNSSKKPPENIPSKFFDIKTGPGFIDKALYIIRAYFLLSTYLAKSKCRNIFVWGSNLMLLLEAIRKSLLIPYKIIGVNDLCVAADMRGKNHYVKKFLRIFYKNMLTDIDAIICQTPESIEQLNKTFKIAEEHLYFISPMVRREFFEVRKNKKSTGQILFIADFVNRENPLDAIDILEHLENHSTILTMIGSGKLEITLKKKTIEHGIEERVVFLGQDADIKEAIDKADVLIVTARHENFRSIMAKSIARGLPAIAYDCHGGSSEIIIDEINGYLVETGNIEEFANKVNLALKNKWDYKRIFETSQKFHPDSLVEKYLDVIRKKLT